MDHKSSPHICSEIRRDYRLHSIFCHVSSGIVGYVRVFNGIQGNHRLFPWIPLLFMKSPHFVSWKIVEIQVRLFSANQITFLSKYPGLCRYTILLASKTNRKMPSFFPSLKFRFLNSYGKASLFQLQNYPFLRM